MWNGLSVAVSEIASRLSRSRLRAFRDPGPVRKTTWSPSVSTQTGTLCGAPSGSNVATWAVFLASRSVRTSAGIMSLGRQRTPGIIGQPKVKGSRVAPEVSIQIERVSVYSRRTS